MNGSQWMQGAIIAAAVAWSVLHVVRKYFPRGMARMQTSLAETLRHARPAFVRRLGDRLQPTTSSASDGGCGSGCTSCSTCDANPQKDVKPLEFHRHI